MKLEFSQQISEKGLNIQFHQNPTSVSRVIPCGQTDMTKLIAAFRNFANAPKMRAHSPVQEATATHNAAPEASAHV